MAATPAPTTTTLTIDEIDIASGTSLKGALLIIYTTPKLTITNVTSNTGSDITFPALSAAPAAGIDVLIFPQIQFNATVSAPADIAQVNGASSSYSSLISPNTTMSAPTAVTVGTAAVQIDQGTSDRRYVLCVNNGSATVYVGKDKTVTTSNGIPVSAGSSLSLNLGPSLQLWGISGTAGQDVRVLEAS